MTAPNSRILMTKIRKIEKKQAERYPHLIERLDRIEQSIVALVNRINAVSIDERKNKKKVSTTFKITCKRLDSLELEILDLKKDTHTHAIYAGTAVPITKDDAEGGSW